MFFFFPVQTVKQDKCRSFCEFTYCKNCINAKPRTDFTSTRVWFCGKHRKFITEHTLTGYSITEECKDYLPR